jgi:hypothetical protein
MRLSSFYYLHPLHPEQLAFEHPEELEPEPK